MNPFQAQDLGDWSFDTGPVEYDPQYLISFPDLPRFFMAIPNADQIDEPCHLALSPKSKLPPSFIPDLHTAGDDDDTSLTSLDPEDMALDDEDWHKSEARSQPSSDPEEMALSDEDPQQPEYKEIPMGSETTTTNSESKKMTTTWNQKSSESGRQIQDKDRKVGALPHRPKLETKRPYHTSTVSTNHGTASQSEIANGGQFTRKRKHVDSNLDSDSDFHPSSEISDEDKEDNGHSDLDNNKRKKSATPKTTKKKPRQRHTTAICYPPKTLAKRRRAARLARQARRIKAALEAVQAQSRLVLLLTHYEYLTVAHIIRLLPTFLPSLDPTNHLTLQSAINILTTFASHKHGMTASQARLDRFYKDSEAAKFASETLLQELKAEVENEQLLWRYGEACQSGMVELGRPWRLVGMSMEEGNEARRWLQILGDLGNGVLMI